MGGLTVSGVIARARSLWRGVRRRGDVEAEMAEEFRHHLELRAADLERGGLSPAEARRRARLDFGSAELHKDAAREARGLRRVDDVRVSWLDFKLGGRMLVKHPGLTLVAVLALSVAIGGGAAYLEFLNDLYHPTLPLPDGERIVGLQNWNASRGEPEERSLHDFVAWRAAGGGGGLETIEEIGAYRPLDRNLITADGRAEPVKGVEISASAFRVVRVPPLLGRPLVEEDERPGGPAVVLLGHALWRTRFASDSGVVGRSVRLGRTLHTVVGVMPPGVAFPVNHALWVPLRLDPSRYARGSGPALRFFGRLAPGVGPDAAQAELTALGLRAAADFPTTNRHLRPRVMPYVESLVSAQRDGVTARRILYALNVFFIGLLGVCGANVATLVFARTATREGEITVRTALGAGRGRIIAQLFAEALVLTSVSAVVGLAAVRFWVGWAKGIAEAGGASVPFWWNDSLAPATLLYAAVLTVLGAVVVGVVPALKATGARLQARLKNAAAGGSNLQFGRLWTGVIVSQVALTVVFLLVVVSIGWNVRVGRYGSPDVAVPAAEYLTVRLEMDRDPAPGAEATEAEFGARLAASYRELERRLTAEPGVVGVTYASRLPGTDHPSLALEADGAAAPRESDGVRWVREAAVGADFFETFGAPIVSGRAPTAAELEAGRAVAVVDQRFVREVFGGRDPVGLRVRRAAVDGPGGLDRTAKSPWYEIVGVVRDLTAGDERSAADPVLYRLAPPADAYPIRVAVRVRGDPRALAARLRAAAAAVDPALRLYDLVPMDEIGRRSRMEFELFVRILAALGAVALLL
jgi:predicted permease